MKILFICGSAEPGRDGVGDYTRRLACELLLAGHNCKVLAFNDRHAAEIIHERQIPGGNSVDVMRLPANASWRSRINHARSWSDQFVPDWISLQYVPYSFDSRGLPFWLTSRLRLITKCVKWHIMFHELWIGFGTHSPLKERIVGALQRQIVKSLIKSFAGCLVTTQATPYVWMLERINVKATKLVLFGNIQVDEPLHKTQYAMASENLKFVHFGSVRPDWDPEEFHRKLCYIFERLSAPPQIIAIGSGGKIARLAWSKLRELGWRVDELNFLPEVQISGFFHSCHYGISGSAPDLIEKSGSAAAMIEHGLPLIVTRTPIWSGKFNAAVESEVPMMVVGSRLKDILNITKAPLDKQAVSNVASTFLRKLRNHD